MNEPTMETLTQRLDRVERKVRLISQQRAVFLGFIATLFLVGTPNKAVASVCIPTVITESSTPEYKYVSAFVDSLSYAKEAGARSEQAGQAYETAAGKAQKHSDLLSAFGEFMYEIKLVNGDYGCAAHLIEAFLSSEHEAIKTSAEGAYLVYTSAEKLNTELLREMQRLFDGKEDIVPGQLLDRATDIRVRKSQMLKLLPVASAAATHALVLLPEKTDERLSRLIITQSERNELLERIEQVFGPSVKQGMKGGQTVSEAAAGGLHQFLSNRAWKALDEK